jgi:hypothetical protein
MPNGLTRFVVPSAVSLAKDFSAFSISPSLLGSVAASLMPAG